LPVVCDDLSACTNLESREIDQPLTIGKEMVALRFLYSSYRVPSSSMYKLSAMASAHSRVKQRR
jgi:hypothetical protein